MFLDSEPPQTWTALETYNDLSTQKLTLQMTLFHPFLWLSNILFYSIYINSICSIHLIGLFIC